MDRASSRPLLLVLALLDVFRTTVIQRDEFEDVLQDMKDDGFPVRPVDEAFARFTEARASTRPAWTPSR